MEGLGKFPDKFERRMLIVILLLLVGAFLASCSANAMQPQRFDTGGVERHGNGILVQVVTDTETGVQYLTWNRGRAGGITPLLDQWGFPLLAEGYDRGHTMVGPSKDIGE